MGVEVDLLGNILGKNKPVVEVAPTNAADADVVEGEAVEVAPEKPKEISKPKPKKSKKKK